jgi:hypothetical protein
MLMLASLVASVGCRPALPQPCHRYDAVALTRENGYAASFDWKSTRAIDVPPERIVVAYTALRPIRGPIEVVQVLNDAEVNRWALTLPDQNNVASGLCVIPPPGGLPSCGAILREVPFFPGGYYYLRPNGNTVLEVGIAFYVCD